MTTELKRVIWLRMGRCATQQNLDIPAYNQISLRYFQPECIMEKDEPRVSWQRRLNANSSTPEL